MTLTRGEKEEGKKTDFINGFPSAFDEAFNIPMKGFLPFPLFLGMYFFPVSRATGRYFIINRETVYGNVRKHVST